MAPGSLDRAAMTLHISPPGVSKPVAELQRKCGFKLFQRRGNRLTVNAGGQLLYNELQRILVGTDDLRLKAEEIREQRFGTLNIASFPAMATRIQIGRASCRERVCQYV